jgi:antitoxin ChpS
MLTTNLRKVGGSVMLAVPPAVLDLLHLEVGSTVSLAVEGDSLVMNPVSPQSKPKYTLDDLLKASDYEQPLSPEDREWIDTPPFGKELI